MSGFAVAGRGRRVVAGHRLPLERPPTANERAWLQLLRDLAQDGDPPVTLGAAQALRAALGR